MVPPPNCEHDIFSEVGDQLMHLPGMYPTRSHGHDLAQASPVLLEEEAARQILRIAGFAQ